MKKWIIVTMIMILAAVGSTGCGDSKKDNIADNSNDSAVTATMTPTLQPATELTVEPTIEPTAAVTAAPELTGDLYPASVLLYGQELFGYINSNGEYVIAPAYQSAGEFHDGVAVTYDYYSSDENPHAVYRVIDEEGTVLYESNDSIRDYSNGAAVFSDPDNNYAFGYLDTTGQILIPSGYLWAEDFNENGQAAVGLAVGSFGIIDKSGTVLESYDVSEEYSYYSVKDGYIIYNLSGNNLMGVINFAGEEVFAPEYSEITYLGNNLFGIRNVSEEEYYLLQTKPVAIYNSEGELLSDNQYDVSRYEGEYASATDEASTYFIGLDGKAVPDLPKLEGIGTMKFIGDIIKANVDNVLIYMRKDGTVIWKTDKSVYLEGDITINAGKYRANRHILVYYPVVEGLADAAVQDAVNEALYQEYVTSQAGAQEDLSVSDSFTAERMDQLLMIHESGYDYLFGAVHGTPYSSYDFIDIDTGEFYELGDLFKSDSDYVTVISDIIKERITEQSKEDDSMYFPEFYTGITEDQYFKLTKDSLIIYFMPYEIAAYAAGMPEFEIPFADITDLIDTEGAFWNSFE